MNCNAVELESYVFHGLKSLLTEGDTLPPRYLEMIACLAFNLTHVGDGNFYADGVGNGVQVSVKTRMLAARGRKGRRGGRGGRRRGGDPASGAGASNEEAEDDAWDEDEHDEI